MIFLVPLWTFPKLTANLTPVWASGDYYQKQIFQNIVFPNGLVNDSKIEHYRIPEINSVIGGVAQLSKSLGEIKKSDSQNLFENPT